jgi:hypothetical protein
MSLAGNLVEGILSSRCPLGSEGLRPKIVVRFGPRVKQKRSGCYSEAGGCSYTCLPIRYARRASIPIPISAGPATASRRYPIVQKHQKRQERSVFFSLSGVPVCNLLHASRPTANRQGPTIRALIPTAASRSLRRRLRVDLVADHFQVSATETQIRFHIVSFGPLIPRLQENDAVLERLLGAEADYVLDLSAEELRG